MLPENADVIHQTTQYTIYKVPQGDGKYRVGIRAHITIEIPDVSPSNILPTKNDLLGKVGLPRE